MDQDWLFQPLISSPNFLELENGKRRMLIVANWNMLRVEHVRSIVGNQTSWKLLIKPKL